MTILSMMKMPQAPKIIQEIVRILRREGVCRAHKAVSLEAPEGGPAAPPAKTGDVANPSPDIMLPPFTEDNEESLLFSPEDGELVGPPSLNLQNWSNSWNPLILTTLRHCNLPGSKGSCLG